MEFSWSDEQRTLISEVGTFAREQLDDDAIARDQQQQFSREAWKRCANFGILALAVPPPYSASAAHDILTCVGAMEAFGEHCADNGLSFALGTQMWTIQHPLLLHGTDEQKQRYLPRLCRGEWIAADGLTEPEHGSDLSQLSTTADRCDGGYRLNGVKTYITLAPLADLALIFATVDRSQGQWGITAFLVETNSEGFERGQPVSKMGLRTVPFGQLTLRDCFVPESNRLGPEGAGAAIMSHALELERCCLLAAQLGAMQREHNATVAYAKTRRQFDQPIGKFQSVSNRVVDMKMRLETARLLLYRVAWLKSKGQSAMLEAAMCKLYLSEQAVASSMDAIRVHGGRGYVTEHGVERNLRDAIGGLIHGGTSDIQRNIIARLLGL